MLFVEKEGKINSVCILVAAVIYLFSHYSFIFIESELGEAFDYEALNSLKSLYNELKTLAVVLVCINLAVTLINLLVMISVTIKEFLCENNLQVNKKKKCYGYSYDLTEIGFNLLPLACFVIFLGAVYLTTL